jgi:hypothetical protein
MTLALLNVAWRSIPRVLNGTNRVYIDLQNDVVAAASSRSRGSTLLIIKRARGAKFGEPSKIRG